MLFNPEQLLSRFFIQDRSSGVARGLAGVKAVTMNEGIAEKVKWTVRIN